MLRRHLSALTAASALAAQALFASCGGGAPGSPAGANVPHPMVRQFSPTMSPIDLATHQANPTYTDPNLLVNTAPAYPGKIVIFFQTETKLDPNTVFIAGNSALGIDLSALQILQFIPGTGNVPLEPAPGPGGVIVENDKIIFTPATLPLPLGQYSIGVFANLKSVEGDSPDEVPVFHSFTVGTNDTILPIVVVTDPVNGQQNVGAGVAAPAPPGNLPASSIADVRTTIFGPISPDIRIRFSESIDAASVSPNTIFVNDTGQFVVGGGNPPAIAPAPGFPKLKSLMDQSSLPSNAFEVIWRADPVQGGLPFGTEVEVTVIGQRDATGGAIVHSAPILDRSGNPLDVTYKFKFQTIAPPDLPSAPEPEYGVYYSTSDKVGVIDPINFHDIALTILGKFTGAIPENVLPERGDQIANKRNLGLGFDPDEISVDARTDGISCHTFAYVQSFQGGQIVILNTRTMLPVALINTPSPGGLTNQTGLYQAANVLIATNSSANTLTEFNVGSITPGRQFLTGPIFIQNVAPTGNTPRAIAISTASTPSVPGSYQRDFTGSGTGVPIIFYADFTDGVVNSTNLGKKTPVHQFPLGTGASPNDVSLTYCLVTPTIPPLMFAAIAEGGAPGEGKVAYWVCGPGCTTGQTAGNRPDAIIGDLSGFDAPAGLDNVWSFSPDALFTMTESGSTANQVVVLGFSSSQLPRVLREFPTAANPTAITHRPSWLSPLTAGYCAFRVGAPSPAPPCFSHPVQFSPPPCQYFGAEIYPIQSYNPPYTVDPSGATSLVMYVCARGAGQVNVIDMVSGAVSFYSPIAIPGVRYIGTTVSE